MLRMDSTSATALGASLTTRSKVRSPSSTWVAAWPPMAVATTVWHVGHGQAVAGNGRAINGDLDLRLAQQQVGAHVRRARHLAR